MTMFLGGSELLVEIAKLTEIVELFKEEHPDRTSAKSEHPSAILASEVKGLLRSKNSDEDEQKPSPQEAKSDHAGIKIDLEKGVLSLDGKKFKRRDKTLDPEFESGQ